MKQQIITSALSTLAEIIRVLLPNIVNMVETERTNLICTSYTK